MVATVTPTTLQNYIENSFKIPNDIKNDIVYCQRALKTYIKVHQMVSDVYKIQYNQNPQQKDRIINELEKEIYEINAEQQILFLRLRCIISDFNKSIERRGGIVIPDLLNKQVSSELIPLINDEKYLIYPIDIQFRCTEDQLIEKYFEVKKDDILSDCIEILDSDEEAEQQNNIFINDIQKRQQNQGLKSMFNDYESNNLKNKHENPHTSLFKPMSRWTLPTTHQPSVSPSTLIDEPSTSKGIGSSSLHRPKPMLRYPDLHSKGKQYLSHKIVAPKSTTINKTHNSHFVEVSSEAVNGNKTGVSTITPNITVSTIIKENTKPASADIYPVSISATPKDVERSKDESSVSKNIEKSRLNLRQVLKNAQNDNLAAKTAVISLPKATGNQSTAARKLSLPTKKPELNKNNRNSPRIVKSSSSSDDSTPERCLTPPKSSSPFQAVSVNSSVVPEDLGQEMFLRLYGLCTHKMHQQMTKRHSRRQRRTVQSNERSDYHYDRIEYGSSNSSAGNKRKRNTFLLSSQVKRKQGRPPKRRSIEKSNEATTSSSGSNSPEEKRACNECLEVGGTLQSCKVCKSHFHQSCHLNIEWRYSSSKIKNCPSCRRKIENVM